MSLCLYRFQQYSGSLCTIQNYFVQSEQRFVEQVYYQAKKNCTTKKQAYLR